jgi:hypothetical protein
MHDSVAGDPMWFVADGTNNTTIRVVKGTDVLTNPSFGVTTLTVPSESPPVDPLQPDGTAITNNVAPFIMKAAESNNTLVACEQDGVSATEDDARWYEIDVSSGTPILADEGNVSAGNNTYLTYPAIDINANSVIGMSYMECGLHGPFLSVYVTGRLPGDPAGTMETPVLVQAGATNYHDYLPGVGRVQRAGDFSGISVDTDGTFWIASEFANTETLANWGTTIAHFTLSGPAGAAAAPRGAFQGTGQQFGEGSFTDAVVVGGNQDGRVLHSAYGVPVQTGGLTNTPRGAKPGSGMSAATTAANMHRSPPTKDDFDSNDFPGKDFSARCHVARRFA